MNKNICAALLAAIAMVSSIAPAAPAFGETLQEAMGSAYGSNPTLMAERAKLRSTDELVPQALANWRPQVSLSGNATRTSLYETIPSGSGVTNSAGQQQNFNSTLLYNNQTIGVTVIQPLFRGGRTVAQTRQ